MEVPRPEGQSLGHLGQAAESIDTRPTLAGALLLHVPDNPSHLRHRAHPTREKGDDPGTERRPQPSSPILSQEKVQEGGHGDPAAAVASEERTREVLGIMGPQVKDFSEWRPRGASITTGTDHRPVTVMSMVPGDCSVPKARNQAGPNRAMRATWARVSTFCTSVGLLFTPRSRIGSMPMNEGTATRRPLSTLTTADS